jgi:hypothetical protein
VREAVTQKICGASPPPLRPMDLNCVCEVCARCVRSVCEVYAKCCEVCAMYVRGVCDVCVRCVRSVCEVVAKYIVDAARDLHVALNVVSTVDA